MAEDWVVYSFDFRLELALNKMLKEVQFVPNANATFIAYQASSYEESNPL